MHAVGPAEADQRDRRARAQAQDDRADRLPRPAAGVVWSYGTRSPCPSSDDPGAEPVGLVRMWSKLSSSARRGRARASAGRCRGSGRAAAARRRGSATRSGSGSPTRSAKANPTIVPSPIGPEGERSVRPACRPSFRAQAAGRRRRRPGGRRGRARCRGRGRPTTADPPASGVDRAGARTRRSALATDPGRDVPPGRGPPPGRRDEVGPAVLVEVGRRAGPAIGASGPTPFEVRLWKRPRRSLRTAIGGPPSAERTRSRSRSSSRSSAATAVVGRLAAEQRPGRRARG